MVVRVDLPGVVPVGPSLPGWASPCGDRVWCLMHLHRFSPERLVPHRSVAMMSLVESNAAFVGHASPIYAIAVEHPADIG